MKNIITWEAYINAGIEKCWEVLTVDKYVKSWFTFSDTWECKVSENKVTSGGRYALVLSSTDGQVSVDHQGIYTSVLAPELLECTNKDLKKYTFKLKQVDGKTKVTCLIENGIEVQYQGDINLFTDLLATYKALCES